MHQHLLFGEDAHNHAVQLNLHACLSRFGQQVLADGDAAQLRTVLLRAEELMNLFEQLAAWASILVEHHHLKAVAGSLYRSAQAGRAGANHNQVVSFHGLPP